MLLALACSERPPISLEHWLSEQVPERVAPRTVGDVTRLGVRLAPVAGEDEVLVVGPVAPGRVEIHLAPAAPVASATATVVLEARRRFPWLEVPLAERCAVEWLVDEGPARWQRCTLAIPRDYRDATLRIRYEAEPESDLFLSDPLWIPRSPAAARFSSLRRAIRPPAAPLPSVFVVLLDTVRADGFAPRRGGAAIGEHWAELAADALVLENARSSSAWTRTATATLLTGLRPWGHRVFGRLDVLDARLETLPELLRRHGYVTLGWSANPNVLPFWGFAQGFDRFVDMGAGAWAKDKTDGERFLDRLREVLPTQSERPTLYYLHLMDAHSPYEPEAGDLERVEALGLSDRFPPAVKKRPEVAESYRRYLGELVDLDEWVASFVDLLRESGLYELSAILLVSDHGEEFLDHGDLLHGRTLYEEMLHVPALLKLPRGAPAPALASVPTPAPAPASARAGARARVKRPVRLEDLMPTLLDALGVPAPTSVHGTSLLGPAADPEAPQLAVLHLDGRRQSAVVLGDWKLIVYPNQGREALYHLAEDPGERHNVRVEHPEKARALRLLLGAAAALHEEGWHVRACGSDVAGGLRLRIAGSGGRVEPRRLEATDSLRGERLEEGIEAALELVPYQAKREVFGKLVDVKVRDEDELLVTDDDATGGLERLEVRAAGEASLRYTMGPEALVREAAQVGLLAVRKVATLPPGGLVECFADKTHRATAEAGGRPYLRIWYVPPPARMLAEEVDPALAERLRALGYQW